MRGVTSRACAPSPASRSSLRARGEATTRLPEDATTADAGAVVVVVAAAGAGVGAGLVGTGAAGAADG